MYKANGDNALEVKDLIRIKMGTMWVFQQDWSSGNYANHVRNALDRNFLSNGDGCDHHRDIIRSL